MFLTAVCCMNALHVVLFIFFNCQFHFSWSILLHFACNGKYHVFKPWLDWPTGGLAVGPYRPSICVNLFQSANLHGELMKWIILWMENIYSIGIMNPDFDLIASHMKTSCGTKTLRAWKHPYVPIFGALGQVLTWPSCYSSLNLTHFWTAD